MKRVAVLGAVFAGTTLLLASCASEATIGSDTQATLGDDGGSVAEDAASPSEDGSLPAKEAGTAKVAGSYTLVLKAGTNGCAFGSWTEGALGIASATLVQSETTVSGTVEGFAAITFGLLLGTTAIGGTASDTTLSLLGSGVTSFTIEGCPYTVDARIQATVKADALQDGTIAYIRNFGGRTDCAVFACQTDSTFTGLRATGDL